MVDLGLNDSSLGINRIEQKMGGVVKDIVEAI